MPKALLPLFAPIEFVSTILVRPFSLAVRLFANLLAGHLLLATFAVLAAATLVRSHAETLYYGLFVERQHRAIWLGNLLFLGCSLALNLVLIPYAGLMGLALAAVASAIFITAWRAAALRATTRMRNR